MISLACHSDVIKMMNGSDLTLSVLYRISGVNWLLSEQNQFSSATMLVFVDLDGLPHGITMGPLSTRLLMDIR